MIGEIAHGASENDASSATDGSGVDRTHWLGCNLQLIGSSIVEITGLPS